MLPVVLGPQTAASHRGHQPLCNIWCRQRPCAKSRGGLRRGEL